MEQPLISIVMGSDSDLPTMKPASEIMQEFGINYEMRVLSAHRTAQDMLDYGKEAFKRGIKVIIAGAGGAAHLPGMLASVSPLPVIGVPVKSSTMNGQDSLLSIVQMPPGVPVATVAIGAGKNAGLLAVQILSVADDKLRDKMINYKKEMAEDSRKKNDKHDEYTEIYMP